MATYTLTSDTQTAGRIIRTIEAWDYPSALYQMDQLVDALDEHNRLVTTATASAEQTLSIIETAQPDRDTYTGLRQAIFWDNLRDCEVNEAISTATYWEPGLILEALRRTGCTIQDLREHVGWLIQQWPTSYQADDAEWAVWVAADSFVMEALGRDSRIAKRAGWD